MSSQDTSNPHCANTLHLLTELQRLLDNPSPDPSSQAITKNWQTLQTTYHSWASFLESCKRAIGGSWHKFKPDRAYRCAEKYARTATSLVTATRDYSTHSRHTASLGRQILSLSSEHERWERTFLLWQFELARADLDRMDEICEKLKGRADKWEKRARREYEKIGDLYASLEAEIGRFVEFHRRMEEAEERVKGFWAGERECEVEKRDCAEGMGEVEAWRYWPVGRLCGGVTVWDCLVYHEHE